MSRPIMSIVSFSAVMAACFIAMVPASAQAQTVLRPFSGRASGAIVGQIPPNGLSLSYTGNATHLGLFTRDETIFVNADGSFGGQLIFYAADGSELHALINGQFTSAATATGQYQFAGGTGRFAAATGAANFNAVTPDGLHVDVVFKGWIRY